jgi:hypothetical protein
MLELELKRYSAYFRGWCQTFGEHEGIPGEESGISWLYTDSQAGFILPQPMIKSLYREVLLHRKTPTLTISHHILEIGSIQLQLSRQYEQKALNVIENMLDSGAELHVFLTSHLLYGTGARIFTLSSKKPLSIIYKEIGSLRIRLE